MNYVSLTDMIAYTLPTTAESMNYSSVILVGIIAVSAIWWLVHATHHYPGPKVMQLYLHDTTVVDGTVVDTETLESSQGKEDSEKNDGLST